MSTELNLLPCPMPDCGSTLVGTGRLPCGVSTVNCGHCGLSVPETDDATAPERWNRRTAAAPIGAEALPPLQRWTFDAGMTASTADDGQWVEYSSIAPHVERIRVLERELADMRVRKDAARLERNQVVAVLAKCFPSGVARTAIEGWSEDWHGCVYIDLPTGQASWHFHDSQAYLFDGLPPYAGKWDGHTTEEKYERIAHIDGRTAGTAPTAPIAWARKWHIDGEKPAKALNADNRMAWPQKFKFHAITPHKIFRDDVPLAAAPSSLSGTEVAK